jgi:hypothetical protein
MEKILFSYLLILFLLGGIGIAFANQKQGKGKKQKAWIKYLVYLLIVNGLFISICFSPKFFSVLCFFIAFWGAGELIQLQRSSSRLSFLSFSIIMVGIVDLV